MKFFIITVLLVAAVSAEYVMKDKDDLIRARKECVAEFKVPATTVEEYLKRVFTPEGPTPCYIRCIFTRLGLFDEKMGYNVDYYLKQLTGKVEGRREAILACIDNTGTDTCMWAYRGFMCFNKGGFLPEGY